MIRQTKQIVIGTLAALTTVVASISSAQAVTYVSLFSDARIFSGTNWIWWNPNIVNAFIPAGGRLVKVTFSAESACYGASGWCTARVVYRQVGSATINEFQPAVGTDFAFDSSDSNNEGSGSWESHAISRSAFLPAGNYQIWVQARTTSNALTLRLDDAHLRVEYE
ncbi:hypothetical protein [Gloeocapsopsis sp. IPPAS B-1203]|uniref:hypothetical protein n=1 Tax=Gloeocapsopsis sp. IPPAS B-1203 TaxID=2049454 RepID=UPI000C19C7B2|nr:hypothetical protein [Gloeocapsopsis sp. IPPAS B-1203]PIG92340.1 hypothetical protein CSQ79_17130 [Gloeocapsopsis sp. IPPAS B-1203]